MKGNIAVTGIEREFDADSILVSHTDLKGRIDYANAAFVAVSGFDSDALLGAPHNIVRHPDMPREAFADMWATLQAGQPWQGLVKNRCKNGDHYWGRSATARRPDARLYVDPYPPHPRAGRCGRTALPRRKGGT